MIRILLLVPALVRQAPPHAPTSTHGALAMPLHSLTVLFIWSFSSSPYKAVAISTTFFLSLLWLLLTFENNPQELDLLSTPISKSYTVRAYSVLPLSQPKRAMAAPRTSSLLVLRTISVQVGHQHPRHLHMTGPATFPTPIVAGATGRAENKLHSIPTGNTTSESQRSRPLNTTRSLKRPNDTTTIDFAFLPSLGPSATLNQQHPELTRVPLLHTNTTPPRTGAHAPEQADYEVVHRPVISTIAAESTHISAPSPMADVHDNTSAQDHIQHVAETVNKAAESVKETIARNAERQGGGILRKFWGEFLDDVFGKKGGSAGAA